MTAALEPVLTVVDAERPDDDLSTDELGSRIVGLAGRLAAATCRWLLLVAEFDRREGCARFGLWSTARWLSHHCGIAHRTALEHVRVAKALRDFPELATEMAAGRLSYSQVRAISRVAREGEHGLITDLVQIAQRGSGAQLEAMVRGVRTADDLNGATETPREYVRTAWTRTQLWSLAARLDPERGALVDSAIRELAAHEKCTAAEALVRMAEIALTVARDADTTRRSLRDDELAAVVVHVTVDSSKVADGDEDEPRSAERVPVSGRLDDGPALPRHVVERLACAGRVRTMVHDCDGTPLDVGRSHRLVTAKQFRALLHRDRGCRHPGCGSRRFLHAHHVRHWMHGGATDLDNLVLLCGNHHRDVHDDVFRLEPLRRGEWRFIRSDGRELPAAVVAGDYADSRTAVETEFATGPDAPTTRWAGERLDRPFAVAILAERRAAAARRGGRADGTGLGDLARTTRRWPADHDPWAAKPA